MSKLTQAQYETLMRPLVRKRISKRSQGGKELSYLEAWDVKAHLTRLFGFCNWDGEVLEAVLAYEDAPTGDAKTWRVGYKVTYQLTIRAEDGTALCRHTESAVGSGKLPDRGEAHDMAIKTAESDALKRAAINLGTQFGLSLYNNGSVEDVIRMTLVQPAPEGSGPPGALPAPSEPAEDEPTVPQVPQDVVDKLVELSTNSDAQERVLAVAGLKVEYAAYLRATLKVDGQGDITLGRYADLVAGGAFVKPQGDDDA